jgi:two-component system, OmpR family, response regulator
MLPLKNGPTSKRTTTVLIVDDDPATRRMVSRYFEQHEVRVSSAGSRQDLLEHFEKSHPSLVILDLRLGREDGLDLLREIRARSDVPVIIATGHRLEEVDRVVGLELGADDYVLKPFGLRELLARVRAVLRRHEGAKSPRAPDQGRVRYRFSGWLLDSASRTLTDPAGADVPLTNGEYALLKAFLDAPQRVLSREQLLQLTRVHDDIFDRSIDVQVLRLRRKLDADRRAPRMIRTERSVGYVFVAEVHAA